MKNINVLLFFIFLFLSSFCNNKNDKIVVNISLKRDTIYLDTTSFSGFNISINNISHTPFKLPREYITDGYSKDGCFCSNYYIEMYLIKDKKKKRIQEYSENYPLNSYFGEYITLNKGESIKFNGNTRLFPFKTSGIYVFRIIFYNDYSYIGKSNWVKVVCIGERPTNNG